MKVEDEDYAISLTAVTFAYPGRNNVLDVPALQVPSGESVFLHGPSGCGKTTLLSLIAGVLSPSSGNLRVLGRELKGMRAGTRDRLRGTGMGYIFQGFNLISYLSVQDNIALPCHLYAERRRRMKATTISEEVRRLAHRLDMAPWLSEPVSRLSVGQQQRVAIARALIGSPQLLIADEPTSSLDTDRRDSFLALLKELLHETASHGQQSTLLFVSHDASLSGHFDRTLSLPSLNTAPRVPNA